MIQLYASLLILVASFYKEISQALVITVFVIHYSSIGNTDARGHWSRVSQAPSSPPVFQIQLRGA